MVSGEALGGQGSHVVPFLPSSQIGAGVGYSLWRLQHPFLYQLHLVPGGGFSQSLVGILERRQSGRQVSKTSFSGKALADRLRLRPNPAASLVASSPWKECLCLGSWLQQSCINSNSPSRPGVPGPGSGSSVSGGRTCLLHTASCTSDVWFTAEVGVGDMKRKHSA